MFPSLTTPSRAPGRFYDISRVIWRGIFRCTMRVHVAAPLEIAPTGGVIVAVSHISHLDPIVVSAVMGRRISWVSRLEFYQQWLMRMILHHGGAFCVNRNGSALPMIREGLLRLNRGEAVGIFPEGELMRGEHSVLRGASIKQGVCLLAARSGRPVVPVVVLGTDRLNRVSPWMPAKRGRLWLHCGSPIMPNPGAHGRKGRAEFAARLTAEYVRLYAELRDDFNLTDDVAP